MTADGEFLEEIRLPVKQPSSVMFGGTDLCDLFITSSCQGAEDIMTGYDSNSAFLGGPLYHCRLAIRGKPEFLADFG
jgi:D-xylonolactonase